MSAALINPADRPEPYCEIAMIDSDIAKMWLENNVHNRILRNDHVKELRGSMSRGEWRLGGCIISFDTTGALTNGQHTLHALAGLPGVVISVVVAYNCDPEVYEVTDRGIKRTIPDILRAQGESNATSLATALQWGYRLGLVERGLAKGPNTNNGLIPTSHQLLELLEENPSIRESIMPASRISRFYRIPSGGLAWLHYQMSQVDPQKANDFISLLHFGEYPASHVRAGQALGHKNPINALRRTLTENLAAKNRRMRADHMMALIIKAANLWYTDKEAQIIKFLPSEDYPVLKWTPRRATATKAPLSLSVPSVA